MEQFKTKIKGRISLFKVMTMMAVAFGSYDVFVVGNSETERLAEGAVAGFQSGIILGVGIIALAQVVKLSMIIKDEKKLKLLYNKEHDERLKAIRSKAGMPMLMITSIMMLIAAIVAGYFNTTVFSTLVIAAIVQLLIGIIVKLYSMKTM